MTRIAIYKDPCGIVWQLEKNGDKQPDIQERAGGGLGRKEEKQWGRMRKETKWNFPRDTPRDSYGFLGSLWRWQRAMKAKGTEREIERLKGGRGWRLKENEKEWGGGTERNETWIHWVRFNCSDCYAVTQREGSNASDATRGHFDWEPIQLWSRSTFPDEWQTRWNETKWKNEE